MALPRVDLAPGQRLGNGLTAIKLVGKGSYGEVWLCLNSLTQRCVAVKFLPRGRTVDKTVHRELQANELVDHPHVVKCHNMFLWRLHLALEFDYCSRGNLQQWISKHGPLAEKDAQRMFQQLILAVDYCHSRGLVNRDIKLENALIDHHWHLKLSDWGFAKHDKHSRPNSMVGSRNYAAPEILAQSEGYDGRMADAYSCGVFLYVMLFGRYPFERADDPEGTEVVMRMIEVDYIIPPAPQVSTDSVHLIRHLITRSPHARLSIKQVMQHPWFQEHLPPGWETLNPQCLDIAAQIPLHKVLAREEWITNLWMQAKIAPTISKS